MTMKHARREHNPSSHTQEMGQWAGNRKPPERQAILLPNGRPDTHQNRINRWMHATEELDAKYRERQQKPHKFVPIGHGLQGCDRCAAGHNDLNTAGQKIHMCNAPGCNREVSRCGLCTKHYQRSWRQR